MSMLDAVIMAAGRLPAHEADRVGKALKALIPIGGATPLAVIVAAMKTSPNIGRIIVVGPRSLKEVGGDVDVWVEEQSSGEENALAGLRAARTRRALISASDVPFVRAPHVDDFLERVPEDADFAYPVYERDDFLAIFPDGRSRFARVGGAQWTGGSICLVNVSLALRNSALIRRGFRARRSQLAMASLLGFEVLARHLSGRLAVEHVERRLNRLTGGKAYAIRGAHPALAMDCDCAADIEYARFRHATLPANARAKDARS